MKSTIKDVAELAGVSLKTVSRVINLENSVRQSTVDKVRDAIAKLDYQPNLAARNLAGNHSFAIGYVYDNPNAYYVIDMQKGILDECREKDYELIIHPCDAQSDNIIQELKNMVSRSRLAGLILSPPLSEMPHILEALSEIDLHFVRIIPGTTEQKESTPCVFVHDYAAAHKITEHLIEQGHNDIAFISGEQDHRSTGERHRGYLDALKENNIEPRDEYQVDGQYSFESGVVGAQQLLGLAKPPSAVFCCNDEIAAGALFAARLAGVEIPKQLAIAGFEDSPFSRQTWPKLTTAAQPTNLIARQAASQLISQINLNRSKTAAKSSVAHQHFEPELVIRESTSNSN
ncbi:LacI family DNA-binding transcriptional regulator [Alteromonadaceae bacterium M269]|nr:LacI family DNA-binding transcriptional regulator [Alteromonadaceae bacterium M269]